LLPFPLSFGFVDQVVAAFDGCEADSLRNAGRRVYFRISEQFLSLLQVEKGILCVMNRHFHLGHVLQDYGLSEVPVVELLVVEAYAEKPRACIDQLEQFGHVGQGSHVILHTVINSDLLGVVVDLRF